MRITVFFPDARWSMSRLWKLVAILLIRVFYRSGRIHTDLDDTLFHRSGKKVDGAGWWRDAVRSSGKTVVYGWGLNLVVLTLRVNPPWGGKPIGLPINMRLHRKNGLSIIELAVTDFTNARSGNALINKLEATIVLIKAGLYQDALMKLQHDFLPKIDGYASTGKPDKDDWIITCEAQQKLYPLVLEIIQLLQSLH